MKRSEQIRWIAEMHAHLVERDVALAVNRVLEPKTACLSDGGRIEVRGAGSVSPCLCGARAGYNSGTGAPVSIAARTTPWFKPGQCCVNA